MNRGRILRLAAVGVGLVGVLLLLAGRQATRSSGFAAAPENAPADLPAAEPRAEALAAGGDALTARVTSVERMRENLERYEREAVYPPWSRPLERDAQWKLAWNEPITSELPFDDRPGQETVYRFGADRAHVMAGEALTSWIEVVRVRDKERVAVEIPAAFVVSTSGAAPGRSVSLLYRDDGREGDEVAGDHKYTNRFVPSGEAALKVAQQVHIRAIVRHDGIERAMLRDFTYAPRSVLDIHAVSDSAEGGNLVVRLDATVREPGTYTLEANLTSDDGEDPIAYADVSVTLGEGRQSVAMPFFGRILREHGTSGPYRVRDIRGVRRSMGGREDDLRFAWAGVHVTKAYGFDTFSGAEWDAPEKRESIASMRSLIEKTANGELAQKPVRHLHVGEDGVAREMN